jgi:hypothetical protein
MIFPKDRESLRRYFIEAWRKRCADLPLEPLEKVISDVAAMHPEYHGLLEGRDEDMDRDYPPELGETNPFLHLALHIGIHEQLSTDRPAGLRQIFQELVRQLGSAHEAEHAVGECLAEMMWQAQRYGSVPDEASYLACLQRQLDKD